jgi:hypothetical protein
VKIPLTLSPSKDEGRTILAGLDLSQAALILCEESGTVRRAMAARGIDAWSCDLLPARDGSNKHLQCDARDVLALGWGLLAVMHPPCTRLCNSGVRHLYIGGKKANGRSPEKWRDLEQAAAFYRSCREAPVPRIALENPVMHAHAIALTGRGPVRFVQPWWFGEPLFKATGFETINLPPLVATRRLTPPKPGTAQHKAWSRIHRMPPGPHRARDRSTTPQGLADAIADQWGCLLLPERQEA